MNNETEISRKLEIFRERLKELRGNSRLQDVAKDIGISRASLGYYENGDRKPDIEILGSSRVMVGKKYPQPQCLC